MNPKDKLLALLHVVDARGIRIAECWKENLISCAPCTMIVKYAALWMWQLEISLPLYELTQTSTGFCERNIEGTALITLPLLQSDVFSSFLRFFHVPTSSHATSKGGTIRVIGALVKTAFERPVQNRDSESKVMVHRSFFELSRATTEPFSDHTSSNVNLKWELTDNA